MSPEFIAAMRKAAAGAQPPTQERLRELLDYDEETGVFRWRVPGHGNRLAKAGEIAGTLRPDGYISIYVDSCSFQAHVLAWRWVFGAWPTNDIDHKNQLKNDNRLDNLRLVTRSENKHNQGLLRNNSSGHKGVYWRAQSQKWRAEIYVNGKHLFLGEFADKADAIAARKAAEQRFFGHLIAGGSSLAQPFRRGV